MLGHLLDTNTLSLWRLDEADGATSFADEKAVSALGAFGGTPTYVDAATGLLGISRAFDGTQALVGPANQYAAARNGPLTVEAWVKLSSTFTTAGIVFALTGQDDLADANRCVFRIRVESNRSVTVQYQGDNAGTAVLRSVSSAAGAVPLNFKTHIAGRKREVNGNWVLDVFVNGVLRGTSSEYGEDFVGGANSAVHIGADKDIAGAFRLGLKGTVDDIRFSNVARGDEEIGQSYRRGYDNSSGALPLKQIAVSSVSVTEKEALAGTSGTPDDTNRYVTNDDARLSDARDPNAHTHTLDEITDYTAPSNVFGIPVFIPDVPGDAALLTRVYLPHAATLPQDLAGSYATATVAATAETVLTLKKNATPIGTVTFAAGQTQGTFSFSAEVSFVAGDLFIVENQATADATLANISVTFVGTR